MYAGLLVGTYFPIFIIKDRSGQEISVFTSLFNKLGFLYFFFNQAGSAKGLKKINEWSDHIINHFWYSCETASKDTTSDEEALSKMKVICKRVLQSSNL